MFEFIRVLKEMFQESTNEIEPKNNKKDLIEEEFFDKIDELIEEYKNK